MSTDAVSIMFSMEKTDNRVLHQYGDRELWFVQAENGSWKIPVWIEWRLDKKNKLHFAHVLPAVCLYYSQSLKLNALLGIHDIQGRKDHWIIPRQICEAILHKAPGITPLYYYKWPSDDCPPIPCAIADINVAMKKPEVYKPTWDSFAHYLSKERKISVSIINAVLRGIAEEGPTWMLDHRKPLDLGFCRLIAAPFRANWKEIVSFKTKFMKLRELLRLPEQQVWKALEDVGLPGILTSPHNIGLRRGWKNEVDGVRIDYTIEAIPSDKFESAAHRIEGKRMSRGSTAYITEFEDTVESLYKSLVMALRSYLSKVAKSYAEVRTGNGAGVLGLVPVLGRRIKVRDRTLDRLPQHITPTDSGFSIFGASDDTNLVRATPPALPKMPAVPQISNDVREHEGEERDGLRVPYADPGGGSGESVLVIRENSGDGMGQTGDWII